jgi:hypothetical protein
MNLDLVYGWFVSEAFEHRSFIFMAHPALRNVRLKRYPPTRGRTPLFNGSTP